MVKENDRDGKWLCICMQMEEMCDLRTKYRTRDRYEIYVSFKYIHTYIQMLYYIIYNVSRVHDTSKYVKYILTYRVIDVSFIENYI